MDSQTAPKQTGRPKKQAQTDIRNNLIAAATQLFDQYDYQAVSTRRIAVLAHTTPAMIRYYFNNKEGLFHAAMEAKRTPMHGQLEAFANDPKINDLHRVFERFYQFFREDINVPSLIRKNILTSPSPTILKRLIEDGPKPAFRFLIKMLTKLQQDNAIKSELDVELLALQIISLCSYPCIFNPMLTQIISQDLDADFYQRLAQQNFDILMTSIQPEQNNETN
jgi:TetR/AcrR family transcriptional regulator